MNFLAHLHLASLAQSSLLGNLAADFVKGNPHHDYSAAIADGIMMHRRIDKLTDTLSAVKQARALFSQQHYRVAPITLDVTWDHFLARHWSQFDIDMSLAEFSYDVEQKIAPFVKDMPYEFQYLNGYLWRERWLENYADFSFIAKVLKGMAGRRPKLAALATSFIDIEQHYDKLEQIFWQFYPILVKQARNKAL